MTTATEATARTLFDFGGEFAGRWTATDDGVMGGRSSSRLVVADGIATFSGVVSLEDGGGFCAVRSPDLESGFSGRAGVSLTVRGDGKTYALCLHTRALMPGTSYRCRFSPPPGVWTEVTLPFEQFVLMRFGFRVGVAPVDPAHVRGVSLLIGDKQCGPFALELARIAVR